jgi:hypothetical protein
VIGTHYDDAIRYFRFTHAQLLEHIQVGLSYDAANIFLLNNYIRPTNPGPVHNVWRTYAPVTEHVLISALSLAIQRGNAHRADLDDPVVRNLTQYTQRK